MLLVPGVVHLNEPAAVFEAMVTGWSRQQRSRQLGEHTVVTRERLIRRFQAFCEVVSVAVDARRCRGLHGVADIGAGQVGAVHDPGLSPDVTDVL